MSEMTELTDAIRAHSCAEAQVSGNYHMAYYPRRFWVGEQSGGMWNYLHEHHEICCVQFSEGREMHKRIA